MDPMPIPWHLTTIHPCCQDAAPAAATGAPRAEGFDLDLVGSAGAWLTDSTLLLALQSSQLVFVHLHADGGVVKRLRVRPDPVLPSLQPTRMSNFLKLFFATRSAPSSLPPVHRKVL